MSFLEIYWRQELSPLREAEEMLSAYSDEDLGNRRDDAKYLLSKTLGDNMCKRHFLENIDSNLALLIQIVKE